MIQVDRIISHGLESMKLAVHEIHNFCMDMSLIIWNCCACNKIPHKHGFQLMELLVHENHNFKRVNDLNLSAPHQNVSGIN